MFIGFGGKTNEKNHKVNTQNGTERDMAVFTYSHRCSIIIYIAYMVMWYSDLTLYFHLNRGLTSVGSFVFVCNIKSTHVSASA